VRKLAPKRLPLLPEVPSPEEIASEDERQYRKNKEDEKYDLRQSHERAGQAAEAQQSSQQSDDKQEHC
jgi:hypothetical protein